MEILYWELVVDYSYMGMTRISFRHNKKVININLAEDNTTVINSYKIKKIKDMKAILKKARALCGDFYAIKKRSTFGMITEWRAHNLLFALKIQRDRTGSVDLELNQSWWKKVGYFVLSILYF